MRVTPFIDSFACLYFPSFSPALAMAVWLCAFSAPFPFKYELGSVRERRDVFSGIEYQHDFFLRKGCYI